MPTSYQAPRRSTGAKDRTASQSVATNTASGSAKVNDILGHKGGDLYTISQGDTIASAVRMLREKRIGALVVVDESGTLAGILSERDIVRKLAETPGHTLPQTVAENMTRDVVTCGRDSLLVDVLRLMSEGRFRHLPVMEGGALAGMITIGDVINYRLNELEHEALQLKQLIVG